MMFDTIYWKQANAVGSHLRTFYVLFCSIYRIFEELRIAI